MKIASWADRHARSIVFSLIVLVLAGLLAVRVLPVSLFPRVNFPRIRVNLDAGERPAERMTVEITRPVEEALRSIPGVRSVRSATSRGSAEVWLTFDWGNDMAGSLLQAESQINKLLPTLPAGTTFEAKRMDPTVFPVIAYSLTSPSRSLAELHDIAQYQLSPVLSTITGVAKIGVDGGGQEEFRVTVDPAKLAAQHVAISDVAAALSAANVLTAVGQIEDHNKLNLVVTDTRFKTIDEIGQTILHASGGGIVRLSDIATIRRQAAPQFIRATADGRETVLMNVYQQPGGNTVQIAAAIRAALLNEKSRLPADVKIASWYDQSDLITASATSVRDAVIIGVILAAIVLLLFLRNWRMTLIAALSVPVVLGVTALLLYLFGETLNIMTLGGMAAAVGLIIDDAIVMSEHIVRRLHHSTSTATDTKGRVLAATDEFTKPLIGSSLSTIIIHIPPAFLVGVTGVFFGALSLAMASSLVVSLAVAWLVIPILAARFLRKHPGQDMEPHSQPKLYPKLMQRTLAWPWLVMLIVLPLLGAGYFAFGRIESGFMPTVDEGGFIIDYIAPPGTSLSETDRMLKQVEDLLHKTPEVLTYSRRTGLGLGGDLNESNAGDFFVRLKPQPRREIHDVITELHDKIEHTISGLDVEMPQLMEDLIGDLTGKPEPIVINLFSEDEVVLQDTAQKVADAIGKIDKVADVNNGIVPAGDALDIEVDRASASLEGVDPDAITKQLEDLLTGNVPTQVQVGEKLVDVRVWIPPSLRKTSRDVENLLIRAPDGHLFPLKRVAKLATITGQPEITREDLKRVVSVTARSDRDLGSTIRDVKTVLDQPGLLPAGMRYTLGGLYEQQQLAFKGIAEVAAAAGALVFLLLLYLYESLRVALAIIITSVLAIAIVFLGLWITGTELNISSMMGMVMIVGNVTEVAIFYYSEFADFPHPGSVRDRLIAAGSYRMRAITMTTFAAILALLPLAVGIGEGSGMLQPLAIAIIAGLVAQLPLVLVVLPAILVLFGMGRREPTSNHLNVSGAQ